MPTIAEQFWKEGKREGREEGREEGKEELKQEIATKLLLRGMDNSLIMELTGLSLDGICCLKRTVARIKVSN